MSALDLVELLGPRRLVVCCGSGGVGKTTISAALGMAMVAAREERVLVLTVDPARRLGTALGLSEIGSRPVAVPGRRLRAAGVEVRGELLAAMLDMKTEWDRLVERHAPGPEVRDRIRASPFYQGLSTAFAGSHDYMALQALLDHQRSGDYDRIVIDTPPSRSALDLLDAPDRLTDFVGARLLTWLAGPSQIGWRAMNLAAGPFLRMADRLLGGEVLRDLAGFVGDLRTLYDGVRQGAEEVNRLLHSSASAFVVATTLESRPLAEAEHLCAELRRRSLPLRAVVANRVLPAELRDQRAREAALRLAGDPGSPAWLGTLLGRPLQPRVPEAWAGAFLTLNRMAADEAALSRRLARLHGVPVATLPLADEEVQDLGTLARLATLLSGRRP